MEKVTLINADCLDAMKKMDENSIDSIVCDPPYALTSGKKGGSGVKSIDLNSPHGRSRIGSGNGSGGFMGMRWDEEIPTVEIWKEALRVAKPGAFLLAFGGCYDSETEVLTRRGWVSFPNITMNDEFASLDVNTEKVVFQKPAEVVEFIHDGPMHYYRTNRIDLLVTPNHKMLVASLGRNPKGHWKLTRSDEVKKSIRMTKTSSGLLENRYEPFVLKGVQKGKGHGHYEQMPDLKIDPETWAAFLGIWLAEGHASKTPGKRGGFSTHVAITHFDQSNIKEMFEMMNVYFRVKLHPPSGRLRVNDPRLYAHLSQFGQAGTKYVPDYVKNWHPNLLKILLDWYARGDGDSEGRIYTASKKLADDIQEIAMYAGYAADISVFPPEDGMINGRILHANYPQYVIRLLKAQTKPEVYSRRRSIPVKHIIDSEKWAKGRVYCVELHKHHTLYVRRNGKAVWCGNTRTYHRLACAIEDAGWELKDCVFWCYGSGFPKSMSASKAIDKHLGMERPVIGYDESRVRPNRINKTGPVLGEKPYDRSDNGATLTAPASPEAEKWEGWGTALKPAVEPIVLARKPLEGTVAENLIKWGVGALNIDGCRIALKEDDRLLKGGSYSGNRTGSNEVSLFNAGNGKIEYSTPPGRFPANLIHDGSEQVVSLFPESKSTGGSGDASMGALGKGVYGKYALNVKGAHIGGLGDSGSAARFFYCAKASKSDRGEGNNHPTVKPCDLMRYLCRLVTPPNGIILDPFMGSGSTGKAAAMEGFNFVGIDRESSYVEIARKRIDQAEKIGKPEDKKAEKTEDKPLGIEFED